MPETNPLDKLTPTNPPAEDTELPATSPPPEAKVLGVTAGDVVKILLGAILGGAITYGVTWLNSRAPHIRYSVSEVVRFPGEKNRMGTFTISMTNDGSKEAENVTCLVDLADSSFIEVEAGPKSVSPTKATSDHECKVEVAMLNPGETATVNVLADNPDKIKPEVSVRATGVNGEKGPARDKNPSGSIVLAIFGFVGFVTLAGKLTNDLASSFGSEASKAFVEALKKVLR